MFYRIIVYTIFIINSLFLTSFIFSVTQTELNARKYAKEYIWPKKNTVFPKDNLYSKNKYNLGKELFMEEKLSGDGTMSCSTCHNPSLFWQDGKPKAVGHKGEILARKTPTILNLGFAQGTFFWDGRAESLEDQALMPITNPNEMAAKDMVAVKKVLYSIEKYKRMFKNSFPKDKGELITDKKIAQAIATFERTIISKKSPFDDWVLGDKNAINEQAKKGFILFNTTANCAKCHSGFRFTDDSFHDIGLKTNDKGKGSLTDFKEMESMQFAFKTPTLRNIVERSPYMHDGQFKKLEDVIQIYEKGGDIKRPSLSKEIKPFILTDEEQKNLLEFLKTLSSKL